MTEERSAYRTTSSRAIPPHTVASSLTQYYADGTTASDTLLLLPILQSPLHDGATADCLHLVHQDNGKLGFCNIETTHTCPCCGFPVCKEHSSTRIISVPECMDTLTQEYRVPLCQTCACLSREQIFAFHALRLLVNTSQEVHNS